MKKKKKTLKARGELNKKIDLETKAHSQLLMFFMELREDFYL